MSKNLRTLQTGNLVKSKSYKFGGDKFWALSNHKVIKELGYTPTKEEVHFTKYYHEKACGDVFVTLAATGKLHGWQLNTAISKAIIPDRIADYGGTVYIEVEMGSQNKIRQKAENYKRYFYQTKQAFEVWFLVDTDKLYKSGLDDLRDFPSHYSIQLLSEFHDYFRSDTQ